MEIYQQLSNLWLQKSSVVVIGKFDGIHLGHQFLLEKAREVKEQFGYQLVVFTFLPGNQLRSLLMTGQERSAYFHQCGVDVLVECDFQEVRSILPEDFLESVLWDRLAMRCLIAGEDCSFGKNRLGTAKTALAFMKSKGCEAQIYKKLEYHGIQISSSYIRECISGGNLELVNHLLGHGLYYQGRVVEGNRLGRTMNFPTLNLQVPEEKMVPAYGVYSSQVCLNGQYYKGITNIGVKPTVGTHQVGLETYLFEYSGNAYGAEITVFLKEFIRPEMKFQNLEQLQEQIKKDIDFIKK